MWRLQMFHNKLVDTLRASGTPRSAVFEAARRLARWHYQWIVTHEFIPAIVGQTLSDLVYKEVKDKAPIINLKYYKPTNPAGRAFIPVEFAVAAYRFGHSITRPRYTVQDVSDKDNKFLGAVSSVPLFQDEPSDNNLNGHRAAAAPAEDPVEQVLQRGRPLPPLGPCGSSTLHWPAHCSRCRPRRCPTRSTRSSLLSQRNLLRGRKMGLPSGQQVARLMGVTPLTHAQLWTNHRIEVDDPHRRQRGADSCASSTRRTRASRSSSPIRNGVARPRCGSTS